MLGAAGLVPALAAAVAVLWGPPSWRDAAATAGAAYAALILSFLGGTWWGLASRAPDATAGRAFAVAVLPSLAGWAALLVDRGAGLILLGLLLIAVLPGDAWLARSGLAPAWWLSLRVPLSAGLALAAIVTGAGLAGH